jgi:hypothetical protein
METLGHLELLDHLGRLVRKEHLDLLDPKVLLDLQVNLT